MNPETEIEAEKPAVTLAGKGRRPSSCSFPATATEMKELFQVCRNIVIRLYPPGTQRNQIRQTLRVTEIRAQTWLANQLNRVEAFDPII
jgi:hypothetical protein